MKRFFVFFVVFCLSVNLFSHSREDALLDAVLKDDFEEVEYQLKHGASPNYARGQKTPLLVACEKGNLDIVELLLESGANASYKNAKGQNALMVAAKVSKNDDILRMLINKGYANVNDADNEGKTVLMYAVQNPNLQIVNFIIDESVAASANYNHADIHGMTVAMYAAKDGKAKALQALIKKCSGIEWNMTDNPGNNVLTYAIQSGDMDTVHTVLTRIPGFDIDKKLPCGKPPLFWAIENNASTQIIELLMTRYRPEILLSTTDSFGNGIEYYAEFSDNAKDMVKAKIQVAKQKKKKIQEARNKKYED